MSATSVRPSAQRGGSGNQSYYSFVRPEFRRGYEIPMIPYQTNGIISRPLWNTKNSVLRIIPGYDPSTGEIFRQNIRVNEYSPEESYLTYLSDTFMESYVLQGFGSQKLVLISDYAPDSDDSRRWGGDTALHVFTRNIMRAVDGKRKSRIAVTMDMKRWTDPRQGLIRYPKTSVLMQALVFTANDRDSMDRDGKPLVDGNGHALPLLSVVCVDGVQSIRALLSALVEPSNPGLPLDALTNNKYGGLAEADGNLLFLNHAIDTESGHNMLRPSVQKAAKGWTPTPYPLAPDVIKALWHPWNELLQFLTVEEQLSLLATEFGADTVNYVVGLDPAYASYQMPAEIAKAGYGRYSRFLDGVKDVAQTVTLSTPAPAAPAAPAAAPAPQAAPVAMPFGMPAAPKSAPKSATPGLAPAAVVDPEKLHNTLNEIRAAAAGSIRSTADEQAATADELLAASDVEIPGIPGVEDNPEDIGL